MHKHSINEQKYLYIFICTKCLNVGSRSQQAKATKALSVSTDDCSTSSSPFIDWEKREAGKVKIPPHWKSILHFLYVTTSEAK